MRTGLVKLRGDIFTNYTWCPSRLKLTFCLATFPHHKKTSYPFRVHPAWHSPTESTQCRVLLGRLSGLCFEWAWCGRVHCWNVSYTFGFLGAEMSIHHSHTARMYTNMHTPMYTNYHNTYIHTQHIYKHKTHIQTHITYTHTQHTHTTHMHTLKHIYTYTTHTHTQLQHIYTSTLSFLLGDNIAPQD